jgi:hypothetical protein
MASKPKQTSETFTEIVFSIVKFRNLISPRAGSPLTLHRMQLVNPNEAVGLAERKNSENILIHSGEATIRFTIKPDANGDVYFPIGIAFQLRRGKGKVGSGDILGRKDFSRENVRLGANDLIIKACHFEGCGSTPQHRYKFSLFIQRERDGALGVIDPIIDNDPGMH